jgi:hypothetical protein
VEPDRERSVLARPRERRLSRRCVDHERGGGDDAVLVSVDDASHDAGGEPEIVGGHDELFHGRLILSRMDGI